MCIEKRKDYCMVFFLLAPIVFFLTPPLFGSELNQNIWISEDTTALIVVDFTTQLDKKITFSNPRGGVIANASEQNSFSLEISDSKDTIYFSCLEFSTFFHPFTYFKQRRNYTYGNYQFELLQFPKERLIKYGFRWNLFKPQKIDFIPDSTFLLQKGLGSDNSRFLFKELSEHLNKSHKESKTVFDKAKLFIMKNNKKQYLDTSLYRNMDGMEYYTYSPDIFLSALHNISFHDFKITYITLKGPLLNKRVKIFTVKTITNGFSKSLTISKMFVDSTESDLVLNNQVYYFYYDDSLKTNLLIVSNNGYECVRWNIYKILSKGNLIKVGELENGV